MKQLAKPDLVFRIGFSGNRDIAKERRESIETALAAVYETIGSQLKAIATEAATKGQAASVASFYSDKAPSLRLVTGLAEGADALASDVLLRRPADDNLRTEIAAVLPFPVQIYRDSRQAEFQTKFDALAAQCTYVLQLDGIYDKPNPDTREAQRRRARAYRAQSTLLLRHCDVMLVVADTSADGRAGGTLETIGRALGQEIPVLLIEAGTAQLLWLEPTDDVEERIAAGRRYNTSDPEWDQKLLQWTTAIVAAPDTEAKPGSHNTNSSPHAHHADDELLTEFFAADSGTREESRRPALRSQVWDAFHKLFKPKKPLPSTPSQPIEALVPFRDRATALNYHYSGLYRGTFLLNYLFAVLAVTIATFCLLLMKANSAEDSPGAEQHTGQHGAVESQAEVPEEPAGHPQQTQAPDSQAATDRDTAHISRLDLLLLLLTLVKLALVFAIFFNTHRANHGHWNDKAIDYRYLAERLRMSYYLPLAGSFRPPNASQPQFASRVPRQRAIDWLFSAIVRSMSPADVAALRTDSPATEDASARLLSVSPDRALESIKASWLGGQIAYHANNYDTMDRMSEKTDKYGKWLNLAVIFVVAVDIVFFVLQPLGFDNLAHLLHPYSKYLIFISAVLPAAVAGLNGIRFQSECRRLADRSSVMLGLLKDSQDRAAALAKVISDETQSPATDLGSWTPEVLRLAEAVARDMIEEVSEWSVVYAKDVREP